MAKSRKRANGEGSICKYENGWRGAISYKDSTGKTKRKNFYAKTQKEVKAKMDSFKKSLNHGVLKFDENITLEEYYYYWLYNIRKPKLKASSFERYDGIYRNYVANTALGKTKLINLKISNIESYYNFLLKEKGKNPSTIKSINKYLKPCLNHAVKEDCIQKNWCSYVDIEKSNSHTQNIKFNIFSLEEQNNFLSNIKNHRLYTLFLTAFASGLRQGELLALKWEDIDFNNNIIKVNKSIRRIKNTTDNKSSLQIQSTKTESSKRDVNIPIIVTKYLREHKFNQNIEKSKYDTLYSDNNFVFATELGQPIDSRNLIKIYKKLLKENNIPYRKFHSIRHTYATRLFEQNVPPKTVQALMGHSNITTTLNIYTHVTNEIKAEEVAKLNNTFSI